MSNKMRGKRIERYIAFFVKPTVKGVILCLLSILLAVVGCIPEWSGFSKIVVVVIIALLNLIAVYLYARFENNYVELCEALKLHNLSYSKTVIKIAAICRQNARLVNMVIHRIIKQGVADLNIWNFDLTCTTICEQISDVLCSYKSSLNSKVSVGYVRLDESCPNQDQVYLSAFYHSSRGADVLHKRRNINEQNSYHDTDFFKSTASADVEILMSSQEVDEKFVYKKGHNKGKYEQFIGIPVYCDKNDNNKIVGLLEIICDKGTKISDSREEIEEYIRNHLLVFVYLMLLLHKLEKAILAVPTKENAS